MGFYQTNNSSEPSNFIINDNTTSLSSTWSSQKIYDSANTSLYNELNSETKTLTGSINEILNSLIEIKGHLALIDEILDINHQKTLIGYYNFKTTDPAEAFKDQMNNFNAITWRGANAPQFTNDGLFLNSVNTFIDLPGYVDGPNRRYELKIGTNNISFPFPDRQINIFGISPQFMFKIKKDNNNNFEDFLFNSISLNIDNEGFLTNKTIFVDVLGDNRVQLKVDNELLYDGSYLNTGQTGLGRMDYEGQGSAPIPIYYEHFKIWALNGDI